jgi:glycosyltransferase involved in cell wall biosynthesis
MSEMIKCEDIQNILFIESPLTVSSLVRYLFGQMSDRDKERWQRVFKNGVIYRPIDVAGDICVITPIVPFPFYSIQLILKINRLVLWVFQRVSVFYLSKRLRIRNIIYWVCNPSCYAGIVCAKEDVKLFCYDLCDDYIEKLSGKMTVYAKWLKDIDVYLTKKADILFVSSKKLYNDRKSVNKNIYIIPNAVDLAYFQKSVSDGAGFLHEFNAIEHPILAYVGSIDYRIDEEIINLIESRHPEWTLVMIGPKKEYAVVRRMEKGNRIRFIGEKSFEEVAGLLSHSDVCIIPHNVTNLTKSMDVLKLYSFIASGKPIVSTNVGGVEEFSGVVKISLDADQFVSNIEHVLNKSYDKNIQCKKCIEIAKENTWKKRAETVHNLLAESLRLNNT